MHGVQCKAFLVLTHCTAKKACSNVHKLAIVSSPSSKKQCINVLFLLHDDCTDVEQSELSSSSLVYNVKNL